MAMTVKSGRWSDPTVWDTGVVPGAGAMAHIKAPHQIIYDRESDVILEDVMSEMGSKLTWDPDPAKETRMRVNTAMLSGITEIVDHGLSATPGKPKHEIVFDPIAGKDPGAGMGLGAVFMGPTRIHGYRKKGHLRAHDLTVAAGATTLYLAGVGGSGWRVGDVLVILGTKYLPPVTTDPQYAGPKQYWYRFADKSGQVNLLNEYHFGEDEQRTITAISGDTITLDAPLTYDHEGLTGTLPHGQAVRKTPVVANVTRSIRFRTATAEEDGHLDPYADITVLQKRAHLMFMRQPDVDLRYFETKNMGRTSTDPSLLVEGLPYQVERAGGMVTVDKLRASNGGAFLEDLNNVRGRYPIHLHWCGGPYHASPMVPLIGATAWAPIGGHPIPGWGITQHGTRAAIEDCVISNVRGAGLVSEIGNETGQWVNNVVTGVRGDGDRAAWGSRTEHLTNHNGAVGVAYDNQSRVILQHGNIAGSAKYAWLYLHQKGHHWKRSLRDVDLRLLDPMFKQSMSGQETWLDEAIGAHAAQIPPFLDNEAIACRFGFSVQHRIGGESGPVKVPMLMERFHCLNVYRAWEVPQYSNTYYQKDCMFQAPANAYAGSRGIMHGSVTWDFNFTNCLLRGYEVSVENDLNYEGFLIDVVHEGPGVFSNPVYRTYAGITTHAVKNVMGDWEDHPTDPNRAIVRRAKSYPLSALPLPYPLEPYGRKLPANKPDGTPYPPVAWGEKPYFVLGDGTNGAASTTPGAINLTLAPGSGRFQGRLHGIVRDSVGDRRYPDWQSNESFPQNVSPKTAIRDFHKLTPEQVIMRHGCWNDNGTWKVRTWFPGADRSSLVRFHFHVDWTLAAGFEPELLARHDLGGPPPEPEWPDKLEAVPDPRPLDLITRNLRFLSRTYLEAVDGRALAHRLRPSEVMTRLEIAGGTDAALFRVENQRLVWAGTQPAVRSAPYEVTIRATDTWGNAVETLHRVVVVSSTGVTAAIVDNFDRADELLTANPAYVMLTGDAGAFAVRSNRLAALLTPTTPAVADLGSLGTSEQEVVVIFAGSGSGKVLMRMVDENNWIGFNRQDGAARLELDMCVNGVVTRIANFPNPGGSQLEVRMQGELVTLLRGRWTTTEPWPMYPNNQTTALTKILDLDPLAEAGSLLLPPNAPKGTKIGLRTGTNSPNPWIDNFSAKALES